MVARGRTCERSLNILFVINDLYTRGNGLAASARRTIALLRERGTVFASCRHRRAMGMIVVSVCLSLRSLPCLFLL